MDKSVAIAIGIVVLVLIVFFAFQIGAGSTTGSAVSGAYQSNAPLQIAGGGCGA